MQVGFVLVHGGCHRASCWDLVLPHLAAPAVAVDMPGRGDRRVVAGMTLDDYASAVVEAIDAAPFEQVVLVGHSLAGAYIPEAARRRPERVRRLVFVSASIPPEGGILVDMAPLILRSVTRWQGRTRRTIRIPRPLARRFFGNDMDEAGHQLLFAQMSPESALTGIEPVSRAGLPPDIGRTYVLLLRDRALPPARQRRFIANLGEPCDVVTLDSGHDPFFSRPADLAAILNETVATPA